MIDSVGLMDKCTFYDGDVYTSRKAGIILESIFKCAGISKYEIAAEIYDILLDGYLEYRAAEKPYRWSALRVERWQMIVGAIL